MASIWSWLAPTIGAAAGLAAGIGKTYLSGGTNLAGKAMKGAAGEGAMAGADEAAMFAGGGDGGMGSYAGEMALGDKKKEKEKGPSWFDDMVANVDSYQSNSPAGSRMGSSLASMKGLDDPPLIGSPNQMVPGFGVPAPPPAPPLPPVAPLPSQPPPMRVGGLRPEDEAGQIAMGSFDPYRFGV
jgi:hypothetical protein